MTPKAFADADGTSDIATIGADQLDRRGDEYLGCDAFPDRQTSFGFQSAILQATIRVLGTFEAERAGRRNDRATVAQNGSPAW